MFILFLRTRIPITDTVTEIYTGKEVDFAARFNNVVDTLTLDTQADDKQGESESQGSVDL